MQKGSGLLRVPRKLGYEELWKPGPGSPLMLELGWGKAGLSTTWVTVEPGGRGAARRPLCRPFMGLRLHQGTMHPDLEPCLSSKTLGGECGDWESWL